MDSLKELEMGVRAARRVLREIQSSPEPPLPVTLLLLMASVGREGLDELMRRGDQRLREKIAELSRIALSYELEIH